MLDLTRSRQLDVRASSQHCPEFPDPFFINLQYGHLRPHARRGLGGTDPGAPSPHDGDAGRRQAGNAAHHHAPAAIDRLQPACSQLHRQVAGDLAH